MPVPDITPETALAAGHLPDDLVEGGIYRTPEEGFEHSLVVLALGHACWLMPCEAGYRLLVEPSVAGRAREELASYDRESATWPPRVTVDAAVSARLDLVTPLFWALAVLAVYRGQLSRPGWTDAGVLDATAIFGHGEWWRALTALFLHADESHLAANLLAGVFVFAAVLSVYGRVRGWLLLGLGAVAGNLAVAAVHYPGPYRSLGASTAIFAALGLLTGRAVRIAAAGGAHHPHRWRSFFVPAASGLVVLALYGGGVPPIDVLAHAAGFVTGVILGLIGGGHAPPACHGHSRDAN